MAVVVAGVWGPVRVVDVCFAVVAEVVSVQATEKNKKEKGRKKKAMFEKKKKTYFQSAR